MKRPHHALINRALRVLTGLSLSLGAAQAASCASPQYQLENITFQTAKRHQIPESLFVAMIATESTFCPLAISSDGALGLGQLMPGTARSLNLKNPMNPQANLEASATYLSSLHQQFKTWDLALAAYNSGPGNVRKYKGIPPFPETIAHVDTILKRAEALGRNVPLRVMMGTAVADLARTPGRPQANVTLLAASQSPASRAINVPLNAGTRLSTIAAPAVLAAAPSSNLLNASAGAGGTPSSTAPVAAARPAALPFTSSPAPSPAITAQLNVSVPPASVQTRAPTSMTVTKPSESPTTALLAAAVAADASSLQTQAPAPQTSPDSGQLQVIRSSSASANAAAAAPAPPAANGSITIIRPHH